MKSFSGLGIGLSLVFGCLLLALVAELYYLLWWKKRFTNREVEENDYIISNHAKDFFYLICWKKPSDLHHKSSTQDGVKDPDGGIVHGQEQDLELGTRSQDLVMKGFGDESVESELMKLHNLSGPPRFLFTIKEETKDDLESEDGKSNRSKRGSRTRSLSDLAVSVDNAFVTPQPSPKLKSPCWEGNCNYHCHGFNPLFESSSAEAELNMVRSSPPPKFKFLRDAEEKLLRRLMEEADKKVSKNCQDFGDKAIDSTILTEETNGSFLGFIVGKRKEGEVLLHHHHQQQQHPSSSSQVLPLASSPRCHSEH